MASYLCGSEGIIGTFLSVINTGINAAASWAGTERVKRAAADQAEATAFVSEYTTDVLAAKEAREAPADATEKERQKQNLIRVAGISAAVIAALVISGKMKK